MLSLSNFLTLVNTSRETENYIVYLKGGVPLSKLLIDIISSLSLLDHMKAIDRIKVKSIYPVDDDLFVELTGVEVSYDTARNRCDFIYTCLKED